MLGGGGKRPRGFSEVGDDVAWEPAGKGKLVVKVDMLVEGTDVPKGMTYRQAARKAVAACISDFAAKGVRPSSFMCSIGVRRGTSMAKVREVASGFRDAEREWGARMVGGDTNEAKELVIDCAMFGFARKIVGRSGAKPGDAVVVSGFFGYPPAGLKILTAGAKSKGRLRERAVSSVLRPTPGLAVGVALARSLSSGIDSSDGLARSLHELAKASRVGLEIITLPVGPGVKGFASENGLDWRDLVLAGGEEYCVVGTVPQSHLRAAVRSVGRAGGKLVVIGKVTRSRGVFLKSGAGPRRIPDVGWTHLG
ncbi:MAG: thiamine-phosphate kinase [archaeon]|nr:MAG: thiamine-phosphate kinase [archaeon]